MAGIKQRFSELRQNTPKRVQWLLLAAAFVVVLILLTLLLSGRDSNSEIATSESEQIELKISPDMINWADVVVGEKRTQTVKVYATGPAKVVTVRRHKNINGLSVNNTCTKAGQINEKLACSIMLEYAPTAAQTTEQEPIFIDWHTAQEPDEMAREAKIVLTLGATMPKIEEKPKPVAEKKVEVKKQPEIAPLWGDDEDDDVIEEDIESIKPKAKSVTPVEKPAVKQEIKREIEKIAPAVSFNTTKKTDDYVAPPETCSDFAFPGYNMSGRQIGWIKPSGGAYYFHPFSDKNCDKPIGVYNPNNGVITDIDNSGKKIGTDADHIGYINFTNGALPELSNRPKDANVNRATQLDTQDLMPSGGMGKLGSNGFESASGLVPAPQTDVIYGTSDENVLTSSAPYDRTFILRQYKPIPATIVSDIRADIDALSRGVPVRATVDRNVYSDNGRTVILPAGTLLLGYVTGEVPGPYKAIGRMNINWYQFIRPDGVEFNFEEGTDAYSGDSQGRMGVPGYGSTDYIEQFVMPMLTAIVPATINLINPVADAFVNQIDLDSNTVVQSGTVRSSELAKNEIITAWNNVAQKLLVDMLDNTVPPFTIAAGTRITVYSPIDLQITCGDPNYSDKKCAVEKYGPNPRRTITARDMNLRKAEDDSWIGQSRSFVTDEYCIEEDGVLTADPDCANGNRDCGGYSYSTLLFWCKSLNYESKSAKQYEVYQADQKAQYDQKVQSLGGVGSQQFNEQILGVKYDSSGSVVNPYSSPAAEAPAENAVVLTCEDGTPPDEYGCCAGEVYTDMGDQGFNCCPSSGGDCFPPII